MKINIFLEINYSKYREILHQKYYTHQMIPNLAKHQMPWKKNKNNKPISPYYRNSVCTWIWWICCYQHKTLIRYVFETINSLTEVIAINPDGVSLVHFHSLNLSRCMQKISYVNIVIFIQKNFQKFLLGSWSWYLIVAIVSFYTMWCRKIRAESMILLV